MGLHFRCGACAGPQSRPRRADRATSYDFRSAVSHVPARGSITPWKWLSRRYFSWHACPAWHPCARAPSNQMPDEGSNIRLLGIAPTRTGCDPTFGWFILTGRVPDTQSTQSQKSLARLIAKPAAIRQESGDEPSRSSGRGARRNRCPGSATQDLRPFICDPSSATLHLRPFGRTRMAAGGLAPLLPVEHPRSPCVPATRVSGR